MWGQLKGEPTILTEGECSTLKLFHKCQAIKNGGGVDLWIDRDGERFYIHLPTLAIGEIAELTVQGDSKDILVEYEIKYDVTKPIAETPDDLRREELTPQFNQQEQERIEAEMSLMQRINYPITAIAKAVIGGEK